MNNKINKNESVVKARKQRQMKNILLVGVGLTATGIAGYFGYQYYKKQKAGAKNPSTFSPPADPVPEYKAPSTYNTTPDYETPTTTKTTSSTSNPVKDIADNVYNVYSSIPKKDKSAFPLKKGSKGDKVRQLQRALIAQHGASILPKYGADGDFGSELAGALKKLGYPARITESLFNVITSSEGANTNSLAKQLVKSLGEHDFVKTISLLKQIGSVSEYTTVSDEFKTMRVGGGVRQTLVNGALNAFLDSKQKQSIRLEFLRMGLKFDGKKWTLSGLGEIDSKYLLTIRKTDVWIDAYNRIPVPQNMILGKPIAQKLDFILFDNKGQHFLVRAKDVLVRK